MEQLGACCLAISVLRPFTRELSRRPVLELVEGVLVITIRGTAPVLRLLMLKATSVMLDKR